MSAYYFCVLYFIENNIPIKICKNCGKYFIPENRISSVYCNRIFENNNRILVDLQTNSKKLDSKIKEFTKLNTQVNLAVSLHAPNDTIRNKIMPISRAYPLDELMSALKEYLSVTNRRITFEYIMLKDINDTKECALELSRLIGGMNAYVNLIPYNETSHLEFRKSRKEQINKFFDCLKREGINVTVRREFGSKIDAACGQLRSKEEA